MAFFDGMKAAVRRSLRKSSSLCGKPGFISENWTGMEGVAGALGNVLRRFREGNVYIM